MFEIQNFFLFHSILAHLVPIFTRQHLKDSQEGYGKCIEIGRWRSVWKIENSAKQLHTKEGKNEDEQEKKK